ncbi:MAG: FAD-dependent thymidylate synthase [Candidatus Dojkabacteria bacterium]|nr:MAG: FAD-dependent thymidylate synthase [Candidatus Dojkabacteria bacterium]
MSSTEKKGGSHQNGKSPNVQELTPLEVPLSPDISLDEADYEWEGYLAENGEVPVNLFQLRDKETGVTVSTTTERNAGRTASVRAWTAARHSREPGNILYIMRQVVHENVDSAGRLEKFAINYGENSIADLAEVYVDLENISMVQAMRLFHMTQVHAGQEKSTRYQIGFGKKPLVPLQNSLAREQFTPEQWDTINTEYQRLGEIALDMFHRNYDRASDALALHYSPQGTKEDKTLQMRAMDCARFFFLFGQRTGMSKKATARTWSIVIAELKASELDSDVRLGEQLQRLLAPDELTEEKLGYVAEAPSLVKHTEADTQFHENLTVLEDFLRTETDFFQAVSIATDFRGERKLGVKVVGGEYTTSEKMIAQYILTLHPNASLSQTLSWVTTLSIDQKRAIGSIIFNGHTDHEQLPQQAVTSEHMVIYYAPIGINRDFNRHRAMGRFTPLPTLYGKAMDYHQAHQILSRGYILPYHLTHIPELAEVRDQFREDMEQYYQEVYNFLETVHEACPNITDYSFLINLLPLGHATPFVMHTDPKKAHYFTRLRVKVGGQADYRYLCAQTGTAIAKSDPILSPMDIPDPDLLSREAFFGRR